MRTLSEERSDSAANELSRDQRVVERGNPVTRHTMERTGQRERRDDGGRGANRRHRERRALEIDTDRIDRARRSHFGEGLTAERGDPGQVIVDVERVKAGLGTGTQEVLWAGTPKLSFCDEGEPVRAKEPERIALTASRIEAEGT